MAAKKARRRSELDYFKLSPGGEYVYTGGYYIHSGERSRKSVLLSLWAFAAAGFVPSVASGCLSAAGSVNCFYVILPYLGEVLSAASVIWAMTRLSLGGERLREYVYEGSVPGLPRRALTCVIFSLVGTAAETVYLLINGFEGKTAASIAYIVLKLICAAAMLAFRRRALAAEWIKEGEVAPDREVSERAAK